MKRFLYSCFQVLAPFIKISLLILGIGLVGGAIRLASWLVGQ